MSIGSAVRSLSSSICKRKDSVEVKFGCSVAELALGALVGRLVCSVGSEELCVVSPRLSRSESAGDKEREWWLPLIGLSSGVKVRLDRVGRRMSLSSHGISSIPELDESSAGA